MSDESGWLESLSFCFAGEFEKNWKIIQQEALTLLTNGQYTQHIQSRKSTDINKKLADDWQVFNLIRPRAAVMPHLAPVTWATLRMFDEIIKAKHGLCYFSLIPPGAIILPHQSGLLKGARSRHQLCLQCPMDNDIEKVHLEVNGEKRSWQQGKLLSFDDAYIHSVKNLSSESRLVLLFDSMGNISKNKKKGGWVR